MVLMLDHAPLQGVLVEAWTPRVIEARLLDAAETLQRLADRAIPDSLITWPEIFIDSGEVDAGAILHVRRLGPPGRNATTRMREVLTWLRWLKHDDARLTWSRAEGVQWKVIAARFGVSVRTAQRRWAHSLSVIVWRLHDRPVPRTWSRRFLLARVEALSRGK